MKKKQNFSIDKDVYNELSRIKEITSVSKSKILEDVLKKGFEDIKKLNYNYSEFIKRGK